MASNNFCIDLRLPTECAKELDLTPNPETPYQSIRVSGKILVLCPAWTPLYTNCWQPLIQLPDGGYGYDFGQDPSGVLVPASTSSGQKIYSFRFYSTGEFIMEFGDAGDEPIPNATQSIITFDLENVNNVLIQWNEINLRYEGNDISVATQLNDHIDEVICLGAIAVPKLLIYYDFATLDTKGKEVESLPEEEGHQ